MTKILSFNNNNNTFFHNTNTIKSIDDIIYDSLIEKNNYLFKKTYKPSFDDTIIINSSNLKDDNDFIKATKFLANYNTYKKKYKLPFIFGKMYTLSDGTPIVFYDDEIQIGFDIYKYSDFSDISFLSNIKTSKKDIIINIYNTSNLNININIL